MMFARLTLKDLPQPWTKENSIKKLKDICLQCIGNNLDVINGAGRYLAPVHKEILLERLAFHDMLTPEYLPYVTYNLFSPLLRRLNLYKCEQLTDGFLRQLRSCKFQLHHLTIHGCPNVSDEGVMALTDGQVELIVLELRKLQGLTSSGLCKIASPKLEKVDLRECSNLTSHGVKTLVINNRNIKVLILSHCNKLDDSAFPLIATSLGPKLEELDVGQSHIMHDSSLFTITAHCPNLKLLNVHGSNKIGAEGMNKLIESCGSLHSLDLSYCLMLNKSPGSECLLRLPSTMRELSLCGIMVEDQQLFVEAITRLTSLRAVRLCGVPALTDDTMEQIMSKIGKNLEQIDLSGSFMSSLTDQGLQAVSKYCTNMEVLALSLLRNITGLSLLPLLQDKNRAANIKTLLFSCRQMSIDALHAVAMNCVNIVCLDMSGLTIVDDMLLFSIAENCPLLTHINIKACRQVTDSGICELARRCPLVDIVLSGIHSVTDRSIFALANSCPYLQEIFLNGCSLVSPVAVRYLLDCCIPRVFIQHKVPNASPNLLMAKNLDTGEFCRADLMDLN